jgi:outer membrane protein assembly factor BamB
MMRIGVGGVLLMASLHAPLGGAAPAGPASKPAPKPATFPAAQVGAPAGEYSLLRLQIEGLLKHPMFVPFRDGKGRVAHPVGITRDGGSLTLKDGALGGTFEVADPASDGSKVVRYAPATLRASVSGQSVSGEVALAGKSFKLTGSWQTEAQLAAANPLAGKSWPAWVGPTHGGTAAEPVGVALVDSLAGARLLWRSEEAIGNSMGSINRFMQNLASATGLRSSGQSAAPVLGEGKVFLHQRVPAGTEFSLKSVYYGSSQTTLEEVKAAGFDEVPWYAMEKYLLQADEQVIAMDARTGKTLWKTVLPLRAPNIQYHKDRGGDRTPVYAEGKLLGLTYNGGLFGLDAATGKLLWENPPSGKAFNPALVAAGRTVLAPVPGGWASFDIETGKQLWRAPDNYISITATVWAGAAKPCFLIPTDKASPGSKTQQVSLHCIEAQSGTVLWSMPFAMGSQRLGIAVAGNTMVAFEQTKTEDAAGNKGADDDGGKGAAGQVCAYQLSAQGAKKLWSVAHSVHPYAQPIILRERLAIAFGHGNGEAGQHHKVIDLASGKVLSGLCGTGPNNGGYVQAMEDLVLVRVDGTHGSIQFGAYQVDAEGKMRALEPATWGPPGPHTTSYHHPLLYPLAEGRMWVRQADGIYCYDLRRAG